MLPVWVALSQCAMEGRQPCWDWGGWAQVLALPPAPYPGQLRPAPTGTCPATQRTARGWDTDGHPALLFEGGVWRER